MIATAFFWEIGSHAQSPVVLRQPRSYDAVLGETVSFEVEATGDSPLVYQWFRDGVPIKDATNAVLQVRAFQEFQSSSFGAYQVEVRNNLGTTLSAEAYLRGFRTPFQFKSAGDGGRLSGASLSYVAVTPNNLPAVYVWSHNDTILDTAQTEELRIPNLLPSQAGTYKVVVTNVMGVLGETSRNLRINTNYFLYSAPESQIAYTGESVRFDVSLASESTPVMLWYKVKFLAWATGTTLVLTNLAVSDNGYYSVAIQTTGWKESFGLIVLPRNPKALPVDLTGWNRDVVLENAPKPFALGFDGVYELHWFEEGLYASPRGLPSGRYISSRWHENAIFELQPYNGPNALWVAHGQQATATLREPASYRRLYFLTASGFGTHDEKDPGGNAWVSFRFTDGSTLENIVIRSLDWNNDPERLLAFGGVHRVNLAGMYDSGLFDRADSYGFGFTESVVDLEELGFAQKELSAVTLGFPPGSPNRQASSHALFALSGEQVGAARAPVVVQEPKDLKVFPGQRARLVAVSIGLDQQYQWLFEGEPIVGQTNATLEFPQVEAANVGGYSLSVSNSAGQVFTRTARLSLYHANLALKVETRPDPSRPMAILSFASQEDLRYLLQKRNETWQGGWMPVGDWLRGTGRSLRFEIPMTLDPLPVLLRVAAFP
ncbi:MAG: hypothetical protein JNK85_03625 [Verrucomicrobiales bacterium]|nr:hypothetical protein [Verrucomicrobiales bacterium]